MVSLEPCVFLFCKDIYIFVCVTYLCVCAYVDMNMYIFACICVYVKVHILEITVKNT